VLPFEAHINGTALHMWVRKTLVKWSSYWSYLYFENELAGELLAD
jgi:hypothetical protein